MRRLAILLLIVACAPARPATPAPAAPAPASVPPIVIAAVLPLTGADAQAGDELRDGIEVAVERVNLLGGVRGRPVELVVVDSAGDPYATRDAIVATVVGRSPSVILGERSVAGTLALLDVVDDHVTTPVIAPTASPTEVTRVDTPLFGLAVAGFTPGQIAAQFVHQQGWRRAALPHDELRTGSPALHTGFARPFRALGGAVVSRPLYRTGAVDYSRQLGKLRGRADVVLGPIDPDDARRMIAQARATGTPLRFVGGAEWDVPGFAGDPDVEGALLLGGFATDDPGAQGFVDAFRARHGVDPGRVAAEGHDAAVVAVDALSRAVALDGRAVADALVHTAELSLATGVLHRFDRHRAIRSLTVVEVRGGATHFVARVSAR